MADISKIKLASGAVVNLKDEQGRTDLSNLISSLKTAAYKDACTAITGSADLPTDAAVKNYVDAQIGSINKFDVVVLEASEELPTASATTMYKLYLKPEDTAVSGSYAEWITIRSGEEGSYTYAWEKIGSTHADLSNYVKKTQRVAGIALSGDISVSDLQTALGLGSLAYKNQVKGSTTLDTIDSITMNDLTVEGTATITTTETEATLTKGDFTPSGTILVDGKAQSGEGAVQAIKGGSISVTLADTTTDATVSYESYTPAGSIAAAAEGGDFKALKTATFGEVVSTESGAIQVGGEVSKPSISLTSTSQAILTSVKNAGTLPTFTEGAFTAASLADGFYTVGTAPSKAADTFTAGSFTKGNAVVAATEGITAAVGTGDDAETLIFTAAATDNVMDHDATFVAPTFTEGAFNAGAVTTLDLTKFNGGSKAADAFTQGALPTFNDGTVPSVSAAALDAAPTFTGKYYKVATTDDTALKSVVFTGTAANVKTAGVTYEKPGVDTATFTGTAATITFSGAKAENVLVTKAVYDKADGTAAYSQSVTPTVKTLTKTAKTIEITSDPI